MEFIETEAVDVTNQLPLGFFDNEEQKLQTSLMISLIIVNNLERT